MSNSVEYEIYMNEHREAQEALALKKYTHAEFKAVVDEKNELEYKLIEINDNISTLLDGECYTGHIPDTVIAYFREIQNIILK